MFSPGENMLFLVEAEEQPRLPGLGAAGLAPQGGQETREVEASSFLGLPFTSGSWRGAQAGAAGLVEELGSPGCLFVSFRGHSHSRSGSRASHCPQGWDKHGPKRNLCTRHY